MRIVLDTNCLLASLSRRSPYFNVWGALQKGEYTLCVSNEILDEYEEIISMKTNSLIASNVINYYKLSLCRTCRSTFSVLSG